MIRFGRGIRLRRDEAGATAIEYSLIAAFIGIGIISALTGTKSSLRSDLSTISTALYQTRIPSPPWTSSTLVSTVASTMNGYASTRQNYVNNDGSTRFINTINDPSKLVQYQVSAQDVTLDANGNVIYRALTTVSGDFPSAGQGKLVDSNFVYSSPNTYTYHQQNTTLGAYAWTDVDATVTNGNLTSQVVTNQDGSRYRSDFTYDAQGNATIKVTQLPPAK